MRYSVLIVIVAVIAIAAFGVWYVIANGCERCMGTMPADGGRTPGADGDAAADSMPVYSEIPVGRWPMFRGGRSLSGATEGAIADDLFLAWRFKTGDEVKSSPVVLNDRAYFGSNDGKIYCVNALTGVELWEYDTQYAVGASPLVLDGVVYVGSSSNFLYALDSSDGRLIWEYETKGEILGSASWIHRPSDGRKLILVGSYDRMLHCVDAESGKREWVYETPHYINGAPAVSVSTGEGKIAFGGCDASVHVVSALGEPINSTPVGSYVVGSVALLEDDQPGGEGGLLYAGGHESDLVCISLTDGAELWRYGTNGQGVICTPAVGGGRVVFGCVDKKVHCADSRTGEPLWTFATRKNVDGSAVICGGKVVIGGVDGRIYVLRLSDGAKLWSYEIGGAVVSSPAVWGNGFLVSSEDGYVYAFAGRGPGGKHLREP